MRTEQTLVEVRTSGRGFSDVTAEIERVVRASGVTTGLCTVFLQHTSASLLVQENADPAVLRDLGRFLLDLAPESRDWEHDDEGPDDMPAHAKAALMRTSETIPVTRGSLALGTWQALYVVEHRSKPHGRRLVVTVMGE
jgi:secondary thiamine-phosphate synthase enzyme